MRMLCLPILLCFVPVAEAPRDELTGAWILVGVELPEMREDFVPSAEGDILFVFDGRTLRVGDADQQRKHPYRVNLKAKPTAIDLAGGSEYLGREKELVGIYEVKGNTARLCLRPAAEKRPADFSAGRCLTLRRAEKR